MSEGAHSARHSANEGQHMIPLGQLSQQSALISNIFLLHPRNTIARWYVLFIYIRGVYVKHKTHIFHALLRAVPTNSQKICLIHYYFQMQSCIFR